MATAESARLAVPGTESRVAPSDAPPRPPRDELPATTLLTPLLRARRLSARAALVGGALGAASGLLHERTYTATATFALQGRRSTPASMNGLAAQLGVALPGADATQSPQFYVTLLGSRTLLARLAAEPLASDARAGVGPPAWRYLALGGDTVVPALRRDAAVQRLRRAIGADVDVRTGLVGVRVTLPDSALARGVGERLLALLESFNLERRRAQASEERRFAEERLGVAERELRYAESAYQQFALRNRDFAGAPDLAVQAERLRRAVSLREQIFLTMTQAYEQARVDEVRATPTIAVIEPPSVPARPDARGTVSRTLAGALAGLLAGLLLGYLRVVGRPAGTPADERAAFDAAVRDTWADLRRPWRLLGRGTGTAVGR